MPTPEEVQKMVEDAGGKVESQGGPLPDGSGFGTASFPLPKDHWISREHKNIPPMPFRMGTSDPKRGEWEDKIVAAGRYAIRCATLDGKQMDFDPDAFIQNLIVGALGYYTPDGLSREKDQNPPEHRS